MGAILTNDLVPIHIRAYFQALIYLVRGIGATTEAAFGGFGIQVLPILLVLVLATIMTPHEPGPRLAKRSFSSSKWDSIRDFDLAGSFLLISAVTLLVLGMNLGGNILPWSHPSIVATPVFSLMARSALVWIEPRAARPILLLKIVSTKPRGNMLVH